MQVCLLASSGEDSHHVLLYSAPQGDGASRGLPRHRLGCRRHRGILHPASQDNHQ